MLMKMPREVVALHKSGLAGIQCALLRLHLDVFFNAFGDLKSEW